MTWYVHRRDDGSIASAHQEPQPDYAEEALKDDDPELAPLINPQPVRVRDPLAEIDTLKAALVRKAVLAESDVAVAVDVKP